LHVDGHMYDDIKYFQVIFSYLQKTLNKSKESILNMFFSKLYIIYINETENKVISNKLIETYLPKKFKEDNDKSDFFLNSRLAQKIFHSRLKYAAISGYRSLNDFHKFYVSDFPITIRTKFGKNGTRTDYVNLPLRFKGSSYKDLFGLELRFKDEANKHFKNIVLKVLNGNVSKTDYELVLYNESDVEILNGVIILLFKTEVDRSPSAFITNIIFLDLLDKGYYKFDDFPTKLPFAIEGAVDAIRQVKSNLKEYLTRNHYYDFKSVTCDVSEYMIREICLLLDFIFVSYKDSMIFDKFYTYNSSQITLKHFIRTNIDFQEDDFYCFFHRNIKGNYFIDLTKIPEKLNFEMRDFKLMAFDFLNTCIADICLQKDTKEIIIFRNLHDLIRSFYGLDLDYLA
jgi:hypothetical protein